MNVGYHAARAQGAVARELYRRSLPAVVARPISPPRPLDFDVFAYSGEAALPEQVASVRSLLHHAGRPVSFTIVSDGTYTDRSAALLESIDSCVSVQRSAIAPPDHSPEKFREYVRTHPTGKQLALIMSLPAQRPALYIDSDVLFFAGARDLEQLARTRDVSAFYQRDCQLSGDERVFRSASEREQPANTGVLMLFRALDWSQAISRFEELQGDATFFTNQSLTHLVMHANGAEPLDPAKYVLELDDQFVFADRHAKSTIALRHYVNPVRHKFWANLFPGSLLKY